MYLFDVILLLYYDNSYLTTYVFPVFEKHSHPLPTSDVRANVKPEIYSPEPENTMLS